MPFLGRNRTLFTLFGFPIKVNPTWLILFFLIVFSLGSADGLFSQWLGDADSIVYQWFDPDPMNPLFYWILGIIGALGLFISLLAHELSHSLIARSTGMPVRGITLFIFGGVSEMDDEPPTAEAEFFMAIVGPISSVIISAGCLALVFLGVYVLSLPAPFLAVFLYLSLVNLLLAIFNSLPAFPLDGGRVVRSALWGLTGDLQKSTHIAATIGSVFGLGMIIFGIFLIFQGAFIGGLWMVFIGFFLRQAATSSYQQVVMRQALGGETIHHFMSAPPVTVQPHMTLDTLVHDYVLPYHFSIFPVVNDRGKLVGTVEALDPGNVDQDEWDQTTVEEIMNTDTSHLEVEPDEKAMEALQRLRQERSKRLVVVQNNEPVGIVSLRDLIEFIELKIGLHPR